MPRSRGRSTLPAVPGPGALLALLLGLGLAALTPLAHVVTGGGITAMDLMSDPVEYTDTPWYLGGVAALNLFLWAAAAALLLVAALGLRHREPRFAAVLAAVGLLAVVVLVNDRLRVHVLALATMGASVALDLTGIDSTLRRVTEETAKMVGAAALTMFPATVLIDRLHASGGARGARPPGGRHTDPHGRSL